MEPGQPAGGGADHEAGRGKFDVGMGAVDGVEKGVSGQRIL
jgi:hypothetical protein